MNIEKKYKLSNDLVKNVKYMHEHFGQTFDMLYQDKIIPVRLVYSESFTRDKCWQLTYNGEVLSEELHVFKLLFYPDNSVNLRNVRACNNLRGSEIITIVLELCKLLKAKTIILNDRAHIKCNYFNIYLSIIKLLSDNRTFYGKYGFIPYIRPGNAESPHGYIRSEEVQEDILKYLEEFKSIKTSEVVAVMQDILNNLYSYKGQVKVKKIYAGSATFQEYDYYHEDLSEQKKDKILKEYRNIISRCKLSNEEYFYMHMITEHKKNCSNYMSIENILYKNHQIYSFIFGEKEIPRTFIVPIIKVIYLHMMFDYIKKL